jgi:histidine triad (HIT) family protein
VYNHTPVAYICPFCLVVQGVENNHVHTMQRDVIFQNERITAIVASHQWPHNPVNTLIMPNAHFENLYDLPSDYALPIFAAAQQLALVLKAVYRCDGVSTRQHNEPAGNQEVWHYHLHVTARYTNDNFYDIYRQAWQVMPAPERAEHAQRLRTAYQQQFDI